MNTTTVKPEHQNSQLLMQKFKDFYKDLKQVPLDDVADIYSNEVRFIDPVHEIFGNDSLRAYMESLCKNLTAGRFEYLDELVSVDSAYIKWNMHFLHPKLGNKQITVRGVSHIQFDDRIYYHEDVYDLGEMLYLKVPVIGSINGWLKNNLKGR